MFVPSPEVLEKAADAPARKGSAEEPVIDKEVLLEVRELKD